MAHTLFWVGLRFGFNITRRFFKKCHSSRSFKKVNNEKSFFLVPFKNYALDLLYNRYGSFFHELTIFAYEPSKLVWFLMVMLKSPNKMIA